MADATNLTGLGSLSSLTGSFQGTLNNALNLGSSKLDSWLPPEKPLSGPPLALFAIMSITVVVFALLGGILVGLIGALLFIVVALGFALLVLLPTLFFTTFAAVFIWLWGLGAYYIIKWFNQKEIPGIHKPLSGSVAKQTGLDSLPLLGGSEHKDQANGEPEKPHRGEGVKKKERKSAGGATGDSDGPTPPQQQQQQHHHQHHGGGGHAARKGETDGEEEKENKPPPLTTPTKKVGSVAKSTGETGDVAGHVGDAKKKVGGVTGAVGVQV